MITFADFKLNNFADCLIVTDPKIAKLYGIVGDNVYLLPEGENAKSFAETEKLCKWFLNKNLSRNGHVVAVGGGSIGDTVAFACSVYKRGGVKLTHVPTTLLAQIDSSIGGKTALNLGNVKNAVGSFYQADTLIDVNFLKTLDKVQLKSGEGELLKYRMLSDNVDNLYCGEITEQVIKACVEYKQKICEIDPFDSHIRKKLNLGHTVGHAMEIVLNLPHGIAVANGIFYETLLAYKLGKCDKPYLDKWRGEVEKRFEIFPLTEQLLDLTVADKKNVDNGVCFVAPSGFEPTYLSIDMVKSLLC